MHRFSLTTKAVAVTAARLYAAFCWQISRTSCIPILTIHALFITVQTARQERVTEVASKRVILLPRLPNPFPKDGRVTRGLNKEDSSGGGSHVAKLAPENQIQS